MEVPEERLSLVPGHRGTLSTGTPNKSSEISSEVTTPSKERALQLCSSHCKYNQHHLMQRLVIQPTPLIRSFPVGTLHGPLC